MDLTALIKEFGLELAATLAVIFLSFLAAKFRRSLILSIAKFFLPELRQSGLVMTYASMKGAVTSIKLSVQKTHDLKILSNKGTDWVGDDNAALTQTINERSLAGLKVRILLLSQDAPWLNAGWAEGRGKPSVEFVKNEFGTAHQLVESYIEKQRNLRHKSGVRYHRDDPIWRMIMTDDRVFISSYANADQARDAVVFEFEGPNSEIYQAYKRYFNFLWHRRGIARGSVREGDASDGRYDAFELSSGAVVYAKVAGDRRILLVERHDGLFTLPKGHVNQEERLREAALREVQEETNLPIEKLNIEKNLGWYPNPILVGDETRVFKVVYYFLVRYESDSFPMLKADVDHKSAKWFTLDEVKGLRYAYSHIERVLYEAIHKFD